MEIGNYRCSTSIVDLIAKIDIDESFGNYANL